MDRLPLRRETPRFTVPEGCEPVEPRYDLVVIGGGLAGLSAAIQAARLGCRVCLIHNRPVLGGNFSSEVRMQIAGAAAMGRGYERFARETGIVEELGTEARWSRWHHRDVHLEPMQDLALLDAVMREPNIDLFLNAEAQMAIMAAPDRIDGVVVDQQGTERHLYIRGRFFVDASGDGRVAASSGAPYRVGREGREEYGESLAPDRPDEKVLGSSILFWVRDEGRPVPFTPPEWAYVFPDEESLPHRHHAIGEPYWWMEWGGTLDTVRDNETIRWELTRIALGVWDHVKNRCVHKERAANYTLEWLGAVVGKRESRRFVGDWTLTQKDIEEATLFPDRIAYGGWPIDLHPPEGIFSPEEPAMQRFLRRLYSIPLRSCYSSEVTNLFLAGRLISVSHVAVVVSWVVGTAVILYSAGLDGIPGELLEAAAIDGTSPWQRLRYVTLPLLKPTTLYVLVTQTIGAFQTFIVVQLLTRGGPAYRTYTLVYDIYVTAFQFFDFGYAAAQGVILLLLAGAVAILQIRFMRGDITY